MPQKTAQTRAQLERILEYVVLGADVAAMLVTADGKVVALARNHQALGREVLDLVGEIASGARETLEGVYPVAPGLVLAVVAAGLYEDSWDGYISVDRRARRAVELLQAKILRAPPGGEGAPAYAFVELFSPRELEEFRSRRAHHPSLS